MNGTSIPARLQGQRLAPVARRVRARGMSLIIVLIFLTAISGLTIWSVRQSILGEGLARNQLDLQVAKQAAEAALRDAERDIMNLNAGLNTMTVNGVAYSASCTRGRDRPPQASDFTATCNQGFCILPETDYAQSRWSGASGAVAEPWWPTGRGGLWNNAFDGKPDRTVTPVDTAHCVFTGGVPLGSFTGVPAVRGVAVQPEYMVEYFRRSNATSYQPSNFYRITARGFGYTQRTQVVLQTVFSPLQE
jgi:type IV pilus assembly protein PilX